MTTKSPVSSRTRPTVSGDQGGSLMRLLALIVAGATALPGGATTAAEPVPAACPVPCFENFDDERADHMTLTGLWHVGTTCDPAPPSPPHYLAYNAELTDVGMREGVVPVNWPCSYQTESTGNSGTATLAVDLSSVTSAMLRFSHVVDTEHNPEYDILTLQVSVDDEATWTLLKDYSDASNTFTTVPGLGWRTTSVSLDPYTGSIVHLRWSFVAADDVFNDYRGWLIDNIEVIELVQA